VPAGSGRRGIGHGAMIGKAPAPDWLATSGILALFAKRRTTARQRYREFVKRVQRKVDIHRGVTTKYRGLK